MQEDRAQAGVTDIARLVISNRFELVRGIVLLALLGYVLWWVLTQLGAIISSANPAIASAVVAGLVALGLALFTFWKERSRSIKEAHREKKIAVYQSFIDMMFRMLEQTVRREDSSDYLASSEFMSQMIAFKKDLLVYGSPGVIKSVGKFMSMSGTSSSPKAVLNAVGSIFLEIRKDIGLSNFSLTSEDLHRLYVTDFDSTENSTK